MRLHDTFKRHGLRPLRQLGQHFLRDKRFIARMIDAISPKKGQLILEIGAGPGTLTEYLAETGAQIIAIEKDKGLAHLLREKLSARFENLEIITDDFLDLPWRKILSGRRALIDVVGNIPYYITSPILFSLIRQHMRIRQAYLTIQKEVADRLLAQPGTRTYGRLTVAVGYFAEVERIFNIPRSAFYPVPRVDSTFIALKFRRRFPRSLDSKLFLDVVRASFAHRRKNILNTLTKEEICGLDKAALGEVLSSCGIDTTRRPEQLTMEDYITLTRQLQRRA